MLVRHHDILRAANSASPVLVPISTSYVFSTVLDLKFLHRRTRGYLGLAVVILAIIVRAVGLSW